MASGEFPCWGREEALNQTQTAPTSGCRGNRLPVAQGTLCVSDGDTLGLGSIKSIQRMFGPISQAGDEDLEPLGGSAEPAVAALEAACHSLCVYRHSLSPVCACVCLGLAVVTTSKMSSFFTTFICPSK